MLRRLAGAGVLATALLLAGCESDEDKLDRLQTEAALARLRFLRLEREGTLPDSVLDGLRDQVILAERELNIFLEGR